MAAGPALRWGFPLSVLCLLLLGASFDARRSRCLALRSGRVPPRAFSRTARRAAAADGAAADEPQVWATSISTQTSLHDAVDEAARKCLAQLPGGASLDLALFQVSSTHLNAVGAAEVVSMLEESLPGIKVFLGTTSGGAMATEGADQKPLEVEAQLFFSLTVASLPDVEVSPFWLDERCMPGGVQGVSSDAWQTVFGVDAAPDGDEQPVFFTVPLPGMSNHIGDLLTGMDAAYPGAVKAGGIASTVSTLQKPRAWVGYGSSFEGLAAAKPVVKLAAGASAQGAPAPPAFTQDGEAGAPAPLSSTPAEDELPEGLLASLSEDYYASPSDGAGDGADVIGGGDADGVDAMGVPSEGNGAFWDGCCGVALKGDIRAYTMVAQGARAVSPVYYVAKSEGNTLRLVRMAKDEDGLGGPDPLAPAVPPLKESSRLQNGGSGVNDDDARLMQRGLLVGLELMPRAAPSIAQAQKILDARRAAKEDAAKKPRRKGKLPPREVPQKAQKPLPGSGGAAEGSGAPQGPQYSVQKVLRTSMKDGSFLLPEPAAEGQRMRFFVRDRAAAEESLTGVLSDYKRRELEATMTPTAQLGKMPLRAGLAFMVSGMDRGRQLFDEVGYESRRLAQYVRAPLSGFFSNGPIAPMGLEATQPTSVHGSSSVFVLLGPRTSRPLGHEVMDGAAGGGVEEDAAEAAAGAPEAPISEEAAAAWEGVEARRRVTDTGRSMNVGSVEWSVAEKTAQPRNRLEALVWAKEAEVDRLRDRYPLPMLLMQVKGAAADPQKKPRGFLEALRSADGVPIVAELKKAGPFKGVLRPDYDVGALAERFEASGAAALSVCTDGRFFGGKPEDVTAAREASALPSLASDFVLYPYQIYQARIAGADALRLTAAALPTADLVYFHKIIKSQGMDPVVVAASLAEAEGVREALAASGQKVEALVMSARDFKDFSCSPQRVGAMLRSERGAALKAALEEDGAMLLVEGGISSKEDARMLADAGAQALIIGEALVTAKDAELVLKEMAS